LGVLASQAGNHKQHECRKHVPDRGRSLQSSH
jgi:hypothetical protein